MSAIGNQNKVTSFECIASIWPNKGLFKWVGISFLKFLCFEINWSNSNSVQRSYKPPQRQWCFHEFFSPFVLKKEEAACAWSFKTDMMWILRVQTCSSGARALAAVWQTRLWSFEFGDTKSKIYFGLNLFTSLATCHFDWNWLNYQNVKQPW